jgi:hypothetical protein
MIALPEEDAHDLAVLFDRLGGRETWGLRPLHGLRAHVHPAVFVERVLPQTLACLDEVLRLTPVERLEGVNLADLRTGPPDNLTFGPGTRVRACLLLGLPVPS